MSSMRLPGSPPALAEHIISYGFGNVYARPGLTPPQRQLVTIGPRADSPLSGRAPGPQLQWEP